MLTSVREAFGQMAKMHFLTHECSISVHQAIDPQACDYCTINSIREVKHGSFTPLAFSMSGRTGPDAKVAISTLAATLAEKRDQQFTGCVAAYY